MQVAAFTDALTQIPNRRWINEKLIALDGTQLLNIMPFSIIMSDVDHFKNFNDTYGHRAGDIVLQMVSSVFTDNLRPTDQVARYGGEEYLVFLPQTPPKMAENVANKLREAISAAEAKDDDGNTLPQVTISMGLCTYVEGMTVENMISKADEALYKAKEAGRNRVIIY
jgi:diguanylate cyclase (GGDEF)-like protein